MPVKEVIQKDQSGEGRTVLSFSDVKMLGWGGVKLSRLKSGRRWPHR